LVAAHEIEVIDDGQLQSAHFARQASALETKIARPHRWPLENLQRNLFQQFLRINDPLALVIAVAAAPDCEHIDLGLAAERAQPHFLDTHFQREVHRHRAGLGGIDGEIRGQRCLTLGGPCSENGQMPNVETAKTAIQREICATLNGLINVAQNKEKNQAKVLPKLDGQFDQIVDQIERRRSVRTSVLIGKSDLRRLNWLVRFGERADSIGGLAPKKLDTFKAQIKAFADLAGSISYVAAGEIIETADVLELAMITRDGLRAYTDGSSWDIPQFDSAQLGLLLVPRSDRGPWIGSWRAMFMIATADLLRAEGARLRLCPSQPGFWRCGRVFIKRKSGLYCSKECSQHERTNRSRGGDDSEEASERRYKASERRHELYMQKVKNPSSKVQVKRRRRKNLQPRKPGVFVMAPVPPNTDLKGETSFFSVLIDHRGMKAVVPFPKKRSKRISRSMPTIEKYPVIALQIMDREVYCFTVNESPMFVMNMSGAKNLLAFELCLKSGFPIRPASPEELTCRGELRLKLRQINAKA
jgi:hypothetical protein